MKKALTFQMYQTLGKKNVTKRAAVSYHLFPFFVTLKEEGMWKKLGESILRYRTVLSVLLLLGTIVMAWQASQVKLSYEFSKAIPTDNPKYQTYQEFKAKFGEDGNLLVIGIQSNKIFEESFFNNYTSLNEGLKKVPGVTGVLSMPAAVSLTKDYETERLKAAPIFVQGPQTQLQIDSSKAIFLNLPFYQGLLYNPKTGSWLMGVSIDKNILASAGRSKVVSDITNLANDFGKKQNVEVHLSGLPLIRTVLADRIKSEMKWFTFFSLALSAIILFLFFRSLSATALSLAVVMIGVIWSFGTMHAFGYKITLLTALIPPLIVVIGIPNCIYFLNKFHTAYKHTGDKRTAIVEMISKMGIVTLFCNIAAAIGFAVFALTKSVILKEFGVVAGINIMLLFFISLILIPAALSVLAPPKPRHVRYLENNTLNRLLDRLELWSMNHRKLIYMVTLAVLAVSVIGIFRLKSVGFIVDDLPKTDKIYTDLKFFESNFKGVMPLEILVDTKKPNGLRGQRAFGVYQKMDSLSQYITAMPELSRPLSLVEGLKFAKQAFFEGDSANYSMPSEYDLPGLQSYLKQNKNEGGEKNAFGQIVNSFVDTAQQIARLSVNMQDVGSVRLPVILDSIQKEANALFDTSMYNVALTGSSVTFLEGSRFIINGLKESIVWAFLLIAACMLYLFKSLRILLCSLIPNIIPLIITAGVMGWAGIPLKPSTVLVFSVALGIAIDVTIRFLVNYKQELDKSANVQENVVKTIHSTGLSIIYTSIVLIAGFII
ncbi:MAG TPA: MMPL family transporter, partial [Chitinophagaceae bacterium]|nr:MMPL family transporter [Chitinophagaceae bacterium]